MRFSLFAIFLFICLSLSAQTEIGEINEFIERYIENTSDEVDIQQLAVDLTYYYEHPLNLNKADATTLFSVPFLTAFQALEIIEHRKKFGNFLSIYELQALPNITVLDIREFLPFVTISTNSLANRDIRTIWRLGEHQILTLAETTRPKVQGIVAAENNLSDNVYLGSQFYNNLRYRFDFDRLISFGFNAEKDAGEEFSFDNNLVGYDYASFYFAARDIGKIKSLNLGDFQANFGQGLTLSNGLAFGKSSIITNSKRNFTGFRAYRSLRENAFLRGGALSIDFKHITVGAFASYKKVDGNGIYSNDTSAIEDLDLISISSLQEDGGFHRTLNEIADKDLITDFQTGFYVEWKLSKGKIGTVNYLRQLGTPLELNTQPYNQFNFEGNQYFKNGLYYDLVHSNVNIYGEVSHSSFDNRWAQIHGALISLGRKLDLSVVYRNYQNGFITMQSNGFGENSQNANEEGFYTGFQAKLSRSFKLLGYYDLFSFPWFRFQADAPTRGNDLWAELQYRPSRVFQAYYRYRTETKQNDGLGDRIKSIDDETTSRHRLHISYSLRKGIEVRNRLEWSVFEENSSTSLGSLIYQDVIYKPFGKKYQISGRVAYSQIDQFENRIYSFEQSPLYDYPLFTHGYSGLRFYVLARLKPRKNLDVWFKYGLTSHSLPLNNESIDYTIGSGLAATDGNSRNAFTLQIRYQIK